MNVLERRLEIDLRVGASLLELSRINNAWRSQEVIKLKGLSGYYIITEYSDIEVDDRNTYEATIHIKQRFFDKTIARKPDSLDILTLSIRMDGDSG